MSSFAPEENKCVILKDKRKIHLNDEGGKETISIVCNGKTVFSFQNKEDYGGGSLWLSPSQSYLLFAYYSGQSEEGFTLFRITDKLEEVYKSYLIGEGASYFFSEDEKLLIQVLPNNCSTWDYDIEDLTEKDEDGNLFYDFGYINIFDIEKKAISEHLIRVYHSDYLHFFETEYNDRSLSPTMAGANVLKLSMPWGDETFNFPLKGKIIFRH